MAVSLRLTAALVRLWAAPAEAGTSWAEIPVAIDPCVDARSIDRAQLAYLVTNELEGGAHEAADRLRAHGARFAIVCENEVVVVRIDRPERSTRVQTRDMDGKVATRTLALAIVELVADVPPPEPAAPPTERPPVVAPAPEPKSTEPARPSPTPPARSRWLASVGIDALGFPLAPLGTFGGAIAVRHRPARHFGWTAALALAGGRDRDPLGRVSAIAVSAFAGGTVHRGSERLDPWGALGVRGGWASLRGRSDDPTVVTDRVQGGWLGPAARIGLDGMPTRRLVLGVHLELGWAGVGVQARIDGRAGPGLAGLWLGGGVSIGLRWRSAR